MSPATGAKRPRRTAAPARHRKRPRPTGPARRRRETEARVHSGGPSGPAARLRPAPAGDPRLGAPSRRRLAPRDEVRRLPDPVPDRRRPGDLVEPQCPRLDRPVRRDRRGGGPSPGTARPLGRRDRHAPPERHDQLPGASERAVVGGTGPAGLLRLRSAPPRRTGSDGRDARDSQERAGSPRRHRPERRRSVTAPTSWARATSSSSRPAGSRWKEWCPSAETAPTSPAADEAGSRSSASRSRSSWWAASRSPRERARASAPCSSASTTREAASPTWARSAPGSPGTRRARLRERLDRLRVPQSPFRQRPPGASEARWVKPELVAEVEFTEWTQDGRLRHPSFKGIREDKAATDVVRERPANPAPEASPARRGALETRRHVRDAARDDGTRRGGRRRSDQPSGSRGLSGRRAITKEALARYYATVAEHILPHLRSRPAVLVRCPDGLGQECFYQKHPGSWAPSSLRRVRIREKSKADDYLVVEDVGGLVGLVQMGVLEIHTWNAQADRIEAPDRLVFDLDPGPDVPWPAVLAAARLVRASLAAHGLVSFVKTTGGKGLHVVTPIEPGPGWPACVAFAGTGRRGAGGGDAGGFRGHHGQERPDRQDLHRLLQEPAWRDVGGRLLDPGASSALRYRPRSPGTSWTPSRPETTSRSKRSDAA